MMSICKYWLGRLKKELYKLSLKSKHVFFSELV